MTILDPGGCCCDPCVEKPISWLDNSGDPLGKGQVVIDPGDSVSLQMTANEFLWDLDIEHAGDLDLTVDFGVDSMQIVSDSGLYLFKFYDYFLGYQQFYKATPNIGGCVGVFDGLSLARFFGVFASHFYFEYSAPITLTNNGTDTATIDGTVTRNPSERCGACMAPCEQIIFGDTDAANPNVGFGAYRSGETLATGGSTSFTRTRNPDRFSHTIQIQRTTPHVSPDRTNIYGQPSNFFDGDEIDIDIECLGSTINIKTEPLSHGWRWLVRVTPNDVGADYHDHVVLTYVTESDLTNTASEGRLLGNPQSFPGGYAYGFFPAKIGELYKKPDGSWYFSVEIISDGEQSAWSASGINGGGGASGALQSGYGYGSGDDIVVTNNGAASIDVFGTWNWCYSGDIQPEQPSYQIGSLWPRHVGIEGITGIEVEQSAPSSFVVPGGSGPRTYTLTKGVVTGTWNMGIIYRGAYKHVVVIGPQQGTYIPWEYAWVEPSAPPGFQTGTEGGTFILQPFYLATPDGSGGWSGPGGEPWTSETGPEVPDQPIWMQALNWFERLALPTGTPTTRNVDTPALLAGVTPGSGFPISGYAAMLRAFRDSSIPDDPVYFEIVGANGYVIGEKLLWGSGDFISWKLVY